MKIINFIVINVNNIVYYKGGEGKNINENGRLSSLNVFNNIYKIIIIVIM